MTGRGLRCPTFIDGARCGFRGSADELREHAEDFGHPACRVCRWPLPDAVVVTCDRCVRSVRDDLAAVDEHMADLERRVVDGAYSGGWLVALTMLTDGSMAGGGEEDHVRYRDPIAVAAWLEMWDRDWREEFGHRRVPYLRLGHPDRFASDVRRDCLAYLRTWLWLAARTHPAFADFAADMRQLRSLVEHVALLVADPVRAPIPCACGGRLVQRSRFGDIDERRREAARVQVGSVARQRHAEASYGVTGLTPWPEVTVAGVDAEGRSDERVCRECGTTYDAGAYLWRYRLLTELDGWVSVERAAEVVDRSVHTVWAWVHDPDVDVPVASSVLTRRVVVELDAVLARSDAAPRRAVGRRSA